MKNGVGNNKEEQLDQENKTMQESNSAEGCVLSPKKKKKAIWGDEP